MSVFVSNNHSYQKIEILLKYELILQTFASIDHLPIQSLWKVYLLDLPPTYIANVICERPLTKTLE